LHDIRFVATTPTNSLGCTFSWVPQTAGEFTEGSRRHSGASTLSECQKACEFDPRCVAVDWVDGCWITTDPNHEHWNASDFSSRFHLRNYIGHYHLVSRCNITPGQCFHDIRTFGNVCVDTLNS